MSREKRSDCPIAASLDVFGDRWSLLILRDMAFRDAHYFGDFLAAREGIASNVLAERLGRLEAQRIVSRRPDPDDHRRFVYSLTDEGLDLIPVLLELTLWGASRGQETSVSTERVAAIRADREGVIRFYRDRLAASRSRLEVSNH